MGDLCGGHGPRPAQNGKGGAFQRDGDAGVGRTEKRRRGYSLSRQPRKGRREGEGDTNLDFFGLALHRDDLGHPAVNRDTSKASGSKATDELKAAVWLA